MHSSRIAFTLLLAAFLSFPIYLLSRVAGAPARRTGADFPGEQSCATVDCHGGQPNTGPGAVAILINGQPLGEYRYRPGETVPLIVQVSDPDKVRWGFQVTARTSDGCSQAGEFSPSPNDGQVQITPTGPGDVAVGCPPGVINFPTHRFPKAGEGGAAYEVDWTAPATNIGPVLFAAAGNAANGNNMPTGDSIYTVQGSAQPEAGSGSPPPAITSGGVVVANLLPTIGTISANALISIFGENLAAEGTARSLREGDLVDDKLPTRLADVCVEVNGERAAMFDVFPTQLNVQAPTLEALGPVNVVVITSCGAPSENRGAPESVTLESIAPAFFVKNFNDSEGRNPIAALHGGGPAVVGDPAVIPGATPAAPGEFISLFGTGFGPTDPPLESGEVPILEFPERNGQARLTGAISVRIGGITVPPNDIFYAGAAPCCAGLYQLVVKVPAGLDGNVEVVATIDGVSTPPGPFILVSQP